ncbi:MAG: AAA family ATPase [Fimbriimonadaceae bacterium]|nr:AAA family ATPase [Fimbriimonadaceae bacterium]
MSNLNEAKRLRSLGLNVVPVAHREKTPSIADGNGRIRRIAWSGYQASMVPESNLESWFSRDIGMGVMCGEVSGFLCVLDFDREGTYEAWKGLFPAWAAVLPTDRRGDRYHVYLRTEGPLQSSTFSLCGDHQSCGDLLAQGKFVVMPPTIHPEGETRVWVNPIKEPIPVVSLAELGVEVPIRASVSPAERVQVERAPDGSMRPGDWFNENVSWREVLEPHGWDLTGISGRKEYWRRPGERAGTHSAVVGFANKNPNWFFNFSPNSHPFEPNNCYSPFAAYALLNHGGDFSKAAKAIFEARKSTVQLHHPSIEKESWEDLDFANFSFCGDFQDENGEGLAVQSFEEVFVAMPEYMQESEERGMDWIVEGLLPATFLALLAGGSKAGKSCFATALAMAVAKGEPFLGLPTTRCPVMWLAVEESQTERALVLKEYEVTSNLLISHYKFCLEKPADMYLLRQCIRQSGARLLIIDPLYAATNTDTLSDGRQARKVLTGLKELCASERIACVLLHHINKNVASGMNRERMADSNQILAAVSLDLLMEHEENSDGTRWITLHGAGRGDFSRRVWTIYSSGPASYELREKPDGVSKSKYFADENILSELRECPEGLTKDELVERTGQNAKTLGNRLSELKKGRAIKVIGKKRRADIYSLSEEQIAA